MQITVTISDAVLREASARSMAVNEFVESLIDKGMQQPRESEGMTAAMDRIRALRIGGDSPR